IPSVVEEDGGVEGKVGKVTLNEEDGEGERENQSVEEDGEGERENQSVEEVEGEGGGPRSQQWLGGGGEEEEGKVVMIAIVLVGEEEERTPIKVVVPGDTDRPGGGGSWKDRDQGPAPRRYEGDPDERGPPRRDDDKPRRRYIRDSADS
ncbi:hypothetical protein GBAR_LOCUS6668, partial [Geodia barretti]